MNPTSDYTSTSHSGIASFRDRRALSKMVIAAFECWGVDRRQQAQLLGLSPPRTGVTWFTELAYISASMLGYASFSRITAI